MENKMQEMRTDASEGQPVELSTSGCMLKEIHKVTEAESLISISHTDKSHFNTRPYLLLSPLDRTGV